MLEARHSPLTAVALVMVLATLAGCGYRLVGQGGSFPQNVKRIYVEMLSNRTSLTGIENTITNQIIFEFTRRNKDGLADSYDAADAVLGGEVTAQNVQTVAPRGRDAAAERRITMSLNLKLTKAGGEIIWVGSGVTDNEVFPVAEDKLQTERNEREAVVRLAARLAERVYNRLTDDF